MIGNGYAEGSEAYLRAKQAIPLQTQSHIRYNLRSQLEMFLSSVFPVVATTKQEVE